MEEYNDGREAARRLLKMKPEMEAMFARRLAPSAWGMFWELLPGLYGVALVIAALAMVHIVAAALQ